MSPDVLAFKVCIFTSIFKFWIGSKWIYQTQILLTLLTFTALPILQKVSICRWWYLFGASYYVNLQFTRWRVINELLLIIFIYSIQKSKSLAKKLGLWMLAHQNSTKETLSKTSNITFAMLPFSHKNRLTKLPSWILRSLLLLMKQSDMLQNDLF